VRNPSFLLEGINDLQVRGTSGDVLGGIESVVEDRYGHVFEDGVGEISAGVASGLASVGLEFVIYFAIAGFSLLNRLLGNDTGQSQFSIPKQWQVALLTKERNGNQEDEHEEHENEGKQNREAILIPMKISPVCLCSCQKKCG